MLARFRTARWLTALLLLASPAVGGQVMPVLHPCAAESAEPDSHPQHGGHGSSHETPTDGAQCSCLGTCQVAAVAGGPQSTTFTIAAASRPAMRIAVPGDAINHPVDSPIDRLPPPTAPPIA